MGLDDAVGADDVDVADAGTEATDAGTEVSLLCTATCKNEIYIFYVLLRYFAYLLVIGTAVITSWYNLKNNDNDSESDYCRLVSGTISILALFSYFIIRFLKKKYLGYLLLLMCGIFIGALMMLVASIKIYWVYFDLILWMPVLLLTIYLCYKNNQEEVEPKEELQQLVYTRV